MFNDTIFIYDSFPTGEDDILDYVSKPKTYAWSMTGEGIAWKTDIHQKFDADSLVEKSITESGNYSDTIGSEVQVPPSWQYGIDKLGTEDDLFYRSQSSEHGKYRH